MTTTFFDSIIMMRFGQIKVAIKKSHGAKKPIKIWDVDVDDILIGYLDQAIRPLFFILPKISEYVKPFNGKNSKLMSLQSFLLILYLFIRINITFKYM